VQGDFPFEGSTVWTRAEQRARATCFFFRFFVFWLQRHEEDNGETMAEKGVWRSRQQEFRSILQRLQASGPFEGKLDLSGALGNHPHPTFYFFFFLFSIFPHRKATAGPRLTEEEFRQLCEALKVNTSLLALNLDSEVFFFFLFEISL
jgi:hypothetical protein